MPKALGHGEAFTAALTFISIPLHGLGPSLWRRMAVDAEALLDTGVVGRVASSLQWRGLAGSC